VTCRAVGRLNVIPWSWPSPSEGRGKLIAYKGPQGGRGSGRGGPKALKQLNAKVPSKRPSACHVDEIRTLL